MAFVLTSCGAANYKEKTVEKSSRLTIPDIVEFTPKQQEQAANELDACDENSPLGCKMVERMLIAFKKMRDQARVAKGEKIP